jgi:hypothetical protein
VRETGRVIQLRVIAGLVVPAMTSGWVVGETNPSDATEKRDHQWLALRATSVPESGH